jgi:hypothetical protein
VLEVSATASMDEIKASFRKVRDDRYSSIVTPPWDFLAIPRCVYYFNRSNRNALPCLPSLRRSIILT